MRRFRSIVEFNGNKFFSRLLVLRTRAQKTCRLSLTKLGWLHMVAATGASAASSGGDGGR
jgi:hypothetical protein